MGQVVNRIVNCAALLAVVGLLTLVLGACSGSRTSAGCAAGPAVQACEPCPERPPEAKPGEAWCKVWDPPVMGTVCEKVCTSQAKRKKVWVPPEYGTRVKLVCVSQPKVHEVKRPGLWKTRDKEVLECPPQECWKRVCCEPSGEGCQGECWTKTEKPAVWRTEKERICVAPPQTALEFTPAEYKCVEERITLKEGFCEEYCEPAQFEMRTREVCVKPGCWKWVRRPDCEIPEELLPALEVRMEDSAPDGTKEGIFKVGALVRYDVTVLSDTASMSMPDLRVVFKLPEHLAFVEGSGVKDGITVSGDGQTAQSSVFPLSVGEEKSLFMIARVLSAPANNLVQLSASVQMTDGTELAVETESSTLTDDASMIADGG